MRDASQDYLRMPLPRARFGRICSRPRLDGLVGETFRPRSQGPTSSLWPNDSPTAWFQPSPGGGPVTQSLFPFLPPVRHDMDGFSSAARPEYDAAVNAHKHGLPVTVEPGEDPSVVGLELLAAILSVKTWHVTGQLGGFSLDVRVPAMPAGAEYVGRPEIGRLYYADGGQYGRESLIPRDPPDRRGIFDTRFFVDDYDDGADPFGADMSFYLFRFPPGGVPGIGPMDAGRGGAVGRPGLWPAFNILLRASSEDYSGSVGTYIPLGGEQAYADRLPIGVQLLGRQVMGWETGDSIPCDVTIAARDKWGPGQWPK